MSDLWEQLRRLKCIDLTHSLSPKIPSWDDSFVFRLSEKDQIAMRTSSGTHIDFPGYFIEKGMAVDQFPLDRLFGPACLIDVSKKAGPSYQISLEDIERYEADYGSIPEQSIVVGFTGWSRHWTNPKAYRNADEKGHTHFPVFAFSALQALVERKIAGVAIDTFALESLQSSFPAHKLLLGAGKFIIENIANASQLPPKGACILALPLKIENGKESPARVIGLL